MSTSVVENPFNKLAKEPVKKKRGLATATPPTMVEAGKNIAKKEHTPAVKPKKGSARTYRVSTQISELHGDKLDQIQLSLKKTRGKKPSIGEILELAIDHLEKNVKT